MGHLIPEKSYCYNCDSKTLHKVLFWKGEVNAQDVFYKNNKTNDVEKLYQLVVEEYNLVECKGCGKVHFVYIGRSSKQDLTIREYPEKKKMNIPDFIFLLDEQYIEMYYEVTRAINENLLMLASMGIRTIIDYIMTQKVGDKGTFKNRLDRMLLEHFISNVQFESFETLIEAGNASAHRGYVPTEENIQKLFDSLTSFLKIEAESKIMIDIKKNIPIRKKTVNLDD